MHHDNGWAAAFDHRAHAVSGKVEELIIGCHRIVAFWICQRPWKFGVRFSMKASIPSRASAVFKSGRSCRKT